MQKERRKRSLTHVLAVYHINLDSKIKIITKQEQITQTKTMKMKQKMDTIHMNIDSNQEPI